MKSPFGGGFQNPQPVNGGRPQPSNVAATAKPSATEIKNENPCLNSCSPGGGFRLIWVYLSVSSFERTRPLRREQPPRASGRAAGGDVKLVMAGRVADKRRYSLTPGRATLSLAPVCRRPDQRDAD